ncbi:hypothetical protein [Streptococcus sp. 20-1249]|uniref:hypothetical protein n=1 Tax=Streptococcus hepaticus TaxID=3349163 RepID=UPI00374895F1
MAQRLQVMPLIIEDVVSKLPDSYFYMPEIKRGDEYVQLRRDISLMQSKMVSSVYRSDENIRKKHKNLVKEYQNALFLLSQNKRKSLIEELKSENLEMQCACMISLINEYRLLPRLREYR